MRWLILFSAITCILVIAGCEDQRSRDKVNIKLFRAIAVQRWKEAVADTRQSDFTLGETLYTIECVAARHGCLSPNTDLQQELLPSESGSWTIKQIIQNEKSTTVNYTIDGIICKLLILGKEMH
jgi:hypothetical protein